MKGLRVVVAVSPDRSDLYFANQLIRRVNVVGVMVENQVPEPDHSPAWRKALRLAGRPRELVRRAKDSILRRWQSRFAIYNQLESLPDFGQEGLSLFAPDTCSVIYTRGVNQLNAPEYVERLRNMKPDVVAVCGASILGPEFLSVPRKGVLNLHGGLAQKYRGLNTTDWAVHNGEPEYVGATVHFVSQGIDDGDIVYQGRPAIAANDTPNSLYAKVVKLGVEMMEAAIRDLETGSVKSVPLPARGTLCLSKAYTNRVRAATWKKYQRGAISDYVADRARRDAKVDQIMLNEFRGSSGAGHT